MVRSLLAASAVLLAVLATTAGCAAAPTPLCDAAATQLEAGHVAAATELSARAVQAQEGDCGTNGLTAASQRYAAAYQEVATGSAAETAGDQAGAITHYEAAQRLDVGNEAAVEGLTRLGQQTTTVDTPVTVTPAPVAQTDGLEWPWVLAGFLVLLAALAGLAYEAYRRFRRLEERKPEDLRPEVARLLERDARARRRDLAEVRDYVDELVTDQLRLLGLVLDRTGVQEVPDDGSRSLLLWPDLADTRDVTDDDEPYDRLDLSVVVARPRATEDAPQLAVHHYRIEAERLDLARMLDDEDVVGAFTALADDPDDTDRLAELESTAVDVRGEKVVEVLGEEPLAAPSAERAFWRAVHGTVVLTWSHRVASRRRQVVCTVSTPAAAATLVDFPALVDAFREPQSAELTDLLRPALERSIVHAVCGEPPPVIAPAGAGELVVVGTPELDTRPIDRVTWDE
ncbi:hypothetical protein [Actinomycetospora termitidis]|uniref:Uncharacterized protein n=1 Tax=Actinomycetospora termitidis TaxID=3053470 RepID=A0ABT7MEK4_9PSEU|nr:hypothetical protein [Actinomycetospora sp. Odt1-22]MDL5158891.1 hypothetical protein [Actinomycetospora sp. Odt1-22]